MSHRLTKVDDHLPLLLPSLNHKIQHRAIPYSLLIMTAAFATALEKPFSVELDSPHVDDQGPIRRVRTVARSDLTTLIPGYPNITTIYDLVRNAVEEWRDKDCLGSRRHIRDHVEEKKITKIVDGEEQTTTKKWIYAELSPYEYRTYRDVGTESNAVGAGLRKLGLKPGDHVTIYSDTWYSKTPNETNSPASPCLFIRLSSIFTFSP
jgi:hypothetical protein